MNVKVVSRSIRLDAEVDKRIEEMAAERGLTISAFIRFAVSEVSERDLRRRKLERALRLAASLPDSPFDRAAIWDRGSDVSS